MIGFHGCDRSVLSSIINGKDSINNSENDYDWLGHGMYFWENNLERAKDWASNSNCIKGYFIPRIQEKKWPLP